MKPRMNEAQLGRAMKALADKERRHHRVLAQRTCHLVYTDDLPEGYNVQNLPNPPGYERNSSRGGTR